MLLCDIGNTSYHFLDGYKEYKENVTTFDPKSIQERIFYICVNARVEKQLENLENWINLSFYISMQNYYETMGKDRIFAVEAVKHGIIVDAGSAITVDVVRNGVFEGGFIYPGVVAMQKTYENISPALAYSFNFELNLDKMPKNSQDAISYGFLKTLQSEVLSHNLPVVLTGGDAEELQKIFPQAQLDNELLFRGMKKIIKEADLC